MEYVDLSGLTRFLNHLKAHFAGRVDSTVDVTDHGEVFNDYDNNKATALYSHARGRGTVASGVSQSVCGKFNISDTTSLIIVGNGTSDTARSNAMTLDSSGNVAFAGTVTGTRVYNAYYNDYAEYFERGGETSKGDIIALDETASDEKYVKATDKSKCVVGVQSEEFAQIIGGETTEQGTFDVAKNLIKYIPVALMGRVHVKVKGAVSLGDLIVPSDEAGVGKSYRDWETIKSQKLTEIGRAHV